jgi:hypothetical protein
MATNPDEQLKGLKYSHFEMIDAIIKKPAIKNIELAEMFGFTPQWISRIICSDSFQARLAQRKLDLIDPELSATVNARVKSTALRSLDIVNRKLDANESASLALETLGLVAKLAAEYNVELPQQPKDKK